jgi:hypothetical protein
MIPRDFEGGLLWLRPLKLRRKGAIYTNKGSHIRRYVP